MGTKRKLVTAAVVLALGTAGGITYWYAHKHTLKPANTTPSTKNETVNTEPSPTQRGVSVTTSQSPDAKNTNSADPSAELKQPSGAFVSNHHPNLSGSPAPNAMNSICGSTAGANCEIHFTMGGTTKVLGPNRVGPNGYVSWDWKLQDIGLTEGSWQIEAIASLNGKTLSTKDPMVLEVKQ